MIERCPKCGYHITRRVLDEHGNCTINCASIYCSWGKNLGKYVSLERIQQRINFVLESE